MDLAGALERLLPRDPLALQPAPPDLRVQHLVGPVVVMEVGGESGPGLPCGLVLEALARFAGHQALLDGPEHQLALERLGVAVEPQREADVEGDLRPVHPARLEGSRAHHRVARFVPELTCVITVVLPRLIGPLAQEGSHHLGHVHLERTLAEQRQVALIRGHVRRVVDLVGRELEVVEPVEACVAPGMGAGNERLGRTWRREGGGSSSGGRSPRDSAGGVEVRPQVRLPFRGSIGGRFVAGEQSVQRLIGPGERLDLLEEAEAQQPPAGVVDQRVRDVQVLAVRIGESGPGDMIDPSEQLDGIPGTEHLLEEGVQRGIGRNIHPGDRAAHLANAAAQRVGVLGVLPLVQCQCALDLPFGGRGKVSVRDLHQALLDPVEAQQTAHVLLDGVTDARGLAVAGDSGQLGDAKRGGSGHDSMPPGHDRLDPRCRDMAGVGRSMYDDGA